MQEGGGGGGGGGVYTDIFIHTQAWAFLKGLKTSYAF